MCVSCGKIVLNTKTTASLTVGGRHLQLTSSEANRIQEAKIQNLQRNNKLALVLDLDHTLLHAVQVDGQTPTQTVQQNGEIHHLPIEDIVNGSVKHLVMKKRPHLDYFLEKANELFQITIYTAGTKRYAEAVVKVIDPTKKYIADRIVSRSDGLTIRADMLDKSLDKIFLKDSSMAVIVDDREDVWKGDQGKQLLLVRPYMYFYPGTASTLLIGAQGSTVSEVNNDPGASSVPGQGSSQNNVKSPVVSLHLNPGKLLTMAPHCSPEYTEADDQLLRCLDIIRDLHKQYYVPPSIPKAPKRSVATLLSDMKHSILSGCTICFSGIIPTNDSHPNQHPLWKMAESLGAQVSTELLPRTTHLLTLQINTKKVSHCLQTRSNDVWVLHLDWLRYCRWSVSRAEESTFLLIPLATDKFPQPKMDSSPLIENQTTAISSTGSRSNPNSNANSSEESRKRRLQQLIDEVDEDDDSQEKPAVIEASTKRLKITEKSSVVVDLTSNTTKQQAQVQVEEETDIATFVSQPLTRFENSKTEEVDNTEDGEVVEENETIVDDDEDDFNVPDPDNDDECGDDEGAYQEGDGDCRAFFEGKLIRDDGNESYTEDDIDGFSYAASLVDTEEFPRNGTLTSDTATSTDEESEYAEFEQILLSRNNSTFSKSSS